jgi:RHH-type proline utilization regulon transcriptional repressor/proline dehydrogenase/delta 1-pyrroline-5-carboxylate dehydrogenase
LEEAVAIVNEVDYGLTSGLHSLNPKEVSYWLEHIQAGNLYVNRTTTGAIVERQPFGGMKRSGNGRDKSIHALEKYLELKTTWIQL